MKNLRRILAEEGLTKTAGVAQREFTNADWKHHGSANGWEITTHVGPMGVSLSGVTILANQFSPEISGWLEDLPLSEVTFGKDEVEVVADKDGLFIFFSIALAQNSLYDQLTDGLGVNTGDHWIYDIENPWSPEEAKAGLQKALRKLSSGQLPSGGSWSNV